jgi:predicted Rossmann fold flavoprotein
MSLGADSKRSADVLVIGAGAAGLMCAIEAARRGRRVLVIDHAEKPAEKIRISGGGRCNFTNLNTAPANFISRNPHFCVSALKRFTQHDFIARVSARGIAFHEKTLGQLFCDGSAMQIIDMLLDDLREAGGELELGIEPGVIARTADGFVVETSIGDIACAALVIATGGKSIPKMGATGYAYDIARRFGLKLVDPVAALVPFTFIDPQLKPIEELAGVSVPAQVSCGGTSFSEGLLFTHRGLSGPAALQISSYWKPGAELVIDLAHGRDAYGDIRKERAERPKLTLPVALSHVLPKRLAAQVAQRTFGEARLADLSDAKLRVVADAVNAWRVTPDGTEGWRTAEVTLGGVDTDGLSSQTMMAKTVPGLYFIGECVDVTGWLGGYNFQWAWSSGWAAGQVV